MSAEEAGPWYWCMRHKRVEPGNSPCAPDVRMGPYESREAAEHWKERVESRNEKWEAEDRAWSGEEE